MKMTIYICHVQGGNNEIFYRNAGNSGFNSLNGFLYSGLFIQPALFLSVTPSAVFADPAGCHFQPPQQAVVQERSDHSRRETFPCFGSPDFQGIACIDNSGSLRFAFDPPAAALPADPGVRLNCGFSHWRALCNTKPGSAEAIPPAFGASNFEKYGL